MPDEMSVMESVNPDLIVTVNLNFGTATSIADELTVTLVIESTYDAA